MRHATIFAILMALFSVCACMENNVPPISYGFVNALVNGKEWNKTYKNAYQANYALQLHGNLCIEYVSLISELYTNSGDIVQFFEIKKLPLQEGKYKIRPFQIDFCANSDPLNASIYTSIGGDVSNDIYNVLDKEDNYIEIESYNSKTREIKGRFEITFVLETRGEVHTLPDTLRFTEGKFHTKIIDKQL